MKFLPGGGFVGGDSTDVELPNTDQPADQNCSQPSDPSPFTRTAQPNKLIIITSS